MIRFHRVFAGLLLSGSLPLFGAPTHVSVSGRTLLIAGKPFTIQGVDYSPTPVGRTLENSSHNCVGGYQWWTEPATYHADFRLIRQLGANTIRTYDLLNTNSQTPQVLKALDEASKNKLHVVMGYFVDTFVDLSDPAVQNHIRAEALTSVRAYKDHPAVLMWAIGSEQNLANGNNATWYDFLNTLAGAIKAADPNHPVTTVEGECPEGGCPATTTYNIGKAAVHADDRHMTHLDLWGITAYRGMTFQGIFSSLASSTMTVKPIFVAEFGKDAYRDSTAREDQDMQASYITSLWREIESNLSATGAGRASLVGGAVFEWTDEWWKDPADDCLVHGTQALFNRIDTVDPPYQEEWFGIKGRRSYKALKAIWNPFFHF